MVNGYSDDEVVALVMRLVVVVMRVFIVATTSVLAFFDVGNNFRK